MSEDYVSEAERITVGLLPEVSRQLRACTTATGMTKTDTVNRAITLYTYITGRIAAGDHILMRDGQSSEIERIHLI